MGFPIWRGKLERKIQIRNFFLNCGHPKKKIEASELLQETGILKNGYGDRRHLLLLFLFLFALLFLQK